MTIPVYQSELNRMGVLQSWQSVPFFDKIRIASQACRARGDSRAAMLLEMNNTNAVAGIRYINDTPSR